jgi:hypothetical protein
VVLSLNLLIEVVDLFLRRRCVLVLEDAWKLMLKGFVLEQVEQAVTSSSLPSVPSSYPLSTAVTDYLHLRLFSYLAGEPVSPVKTAE